MSVDKLVLSWNEVNVLCSSIYNKLIDINFKPDKIIAIARGGWYLSLILSEMFNVRDLNSIKAKHWTDYGKMLNDVTIDDICTEDKINPLDNKSILIVDDLIDTGLTMVEVIDKMLISKRCKYDIKVVTLHAKVNHITSDVATYICGSDELMNKNEWIIYPWEIM